MITALSENSLGKQLIQTFNFKDDFPLTVSNFLLFTHVDARLSLVDLFAYVEQSFCVVSLFNDTKQRA